MTQSGFIAAIDLGTSSIKGVVGRKNENNVVSILAKGDIDSRNCIRRGTVYNIEETGANIRKLIALLENSMDRKIGKVYVSLGGQSLRSIDYKESIQLSDGEMVNEDMVGRLRTLAEKHSPELAKSYEVADVEFFIDNKPERKPVGVTGSMLEASFKLIVGRPNLMVNIEKSVAKKGDMAIADYIIGAIAAAEIALNDEEKELGCVFVDFGSGTSTVSIYKSGILRGMVVIPFGGKNITKDICAMNFTENDAEQLKIKYGKALENQESSFFSSPFSSKPDVDLAELNRVIKMRLGEITANIKEQIRLSGYAEELGAGMIITGGASQLKYLDSYLQQELKMNVRKATAKKSLINNYPELVNDPAYTKVLGMLLLGDDDCELQVIEHQEAFEKTEDDNDTKETKGGKKVEKNGKGKDLKKKGGKIISTMEDFFGGMFSSEDE